MMWALLLLLIAVCAYAVRGRSSQVFGPSVYRGDRSRPFIALTFDDGPSESTPQLLALLEQHNVPATFFMCGQNVDRLPHIARAVALAGHEIGNHSDSHPRLDFCSPAFIHGELSRTQNKITQATGEIPRLFRAPFGVRWFGLRAAQQDLALLGVMWTIIGKDWKWPAQRISAKLIQARAGDILCFHDGRLTQTSPDISATLEALGIALPVLQARGLSFATVSALIGKPS